MHKRDDVLLLSASDLVGHLNCGHLTQLDWAVAHGTLAAPAYADPMRDLLRARGAQHEQGFVDHLKAQGRTITVIDAVEEDTAVAHTLAAMQAGAEIIVQGALRAGVFVGRVDVLQRVDTPSALGAWSYEAVDSKLARATKAGTVLQLCLYAALLADTQGHRPEASHVVVPWTDFALLPYRMDEYAAYYRYVRSALEKAVATGAAAEVYPEPKAHCEVCRWYVRCDARRRADDHLSLVANISKLQTDELMSLGVTTLSSLAALPEPLPFKPARGSVAAYQRVREQARVQLVGREAGSVVHELLPIVAGFGLSSLPAPSPGDIFLDLEGDPFAGEGGLEYLFGYFTVAADGAHTYVGDWALTRAEEKLAFERFVDFVIQRRQVFPDLHVYHFAPYEPAALKRLMGRYATREAEIDTLLRDHAFVDLFAAVRHGVRASVESYSIKKLEPLYGFTRAAALADANEALTRVSVALELGDHALLDADTRTTVARYNRDDCESTQGLRDWLEARRSELENEGQLVPRPTPPEQQPQEELNERQAQIAAMVAELTRDVPADAAERSTEQQARWLLAHCLDWHRREDKAVWWEHYRLAGMTADELLDEKAGLSGLVFLKGNGGTAACPIHRYSFAPQDGEVRRGDTVRSVGGECFGKVEAISWDEYWVDIKKHKATAQLHAEAIYRHTYVPTGVLADALLRLGQHVIDQGIEGPGAFLAARDLLLEVAPRVGGNDLRQEAEEPAQAARRLGLLLEGGVLPIQGPPGSGKTHTGAQMICALVQAGKKVGVCATSHKVIRHLIEGVLRAAKTQGLDLRCVEKVSKAEDGPPGLQCLVKPEAVFAALADGANVAGGTQWLWASAAATGAVDVLFVDEAAQMALANVLAASQAATSVVLLGDPQQLEQPIQGSHPERTAVSALHHVIGAAPTLPADRGLFLTETWRLHPDVCDFTSEMFYAGRLHPRPGLEIQTISSTGRVQGTGLRFLAVPTHANQSSSPEEADAVKALVDEILVSNTTWTDQDGKVRAVTLQDILIIAPYNAQVAELSERLPGAHVGTVDKFQGQEAPIVVYSMTTSSHADAPRGMEFLYSLNRLNVATSRARCVCVMVGSPSVFEVACRTPRQMQLANAFCRYLELASPLP